MALRKRVNTTNLDRPISCNIPEFFTIAAISLTITTMDLGYNDDDAQKQFRRKWLSLAPPGVVLIFL